jgi:hypothetical protein
VGRTETVSAESPASLRIARIRDKFEADDTVHKQGTARSHTATSPASSAAVLQQLTHRL